MDRRYENGNPRQHYSDAVTPGRLHFSHSLTHAPRSEVPPSEFDPRTFAGTSRNLQDVNTFGTVSRRVLDADDDDDEEEAELQHAINSPVMPQYSAPPRTAPQRHIGSPGSTPPPDRLGGHSQYPGAEGPDDIYDQGANRLDRFRGPLPQHPTDQNDHSQYDDHDDGYEQQHQHQQQQQQQQQQGPAHPDRFSGQIQYDDERDGGYYDDDQGPRHPDDYSNPPSQYSQEDDRMYEQGQPGHFYAGKDGVPPEHFSRRAQYAHDDDHGGDEGSYDQRGPNHPEQYPGPQYADQEDGYDQGPAHPGRFIYPGEDGRPAERYHEQPRYADQDDGYDQEPNGEEVAMGVMVDDDHSQVDEYSDDLTGQLGAPHTAAVGRASSGSPIHLPHEYPRQPEFANDSRARTSSPNRPVVASSAIPQESADMSESNDSALDTSLRRARNSMIAIQQKNSPLTQLKPEELPPLPCPSGAQEPALASRTSRRCLERIRKNVKEPTLVVGRRVRQPLLIAVTCENCSKELHVPKSAIVVSCPSCQAHSAASPRRNGAGR